jgi:hypothetical protein
MNTGIATFDRKKTLRGEYHKPLNKTLKTMKPQKKH